MCLEPKKGIIKNLSAGHSPFPDLLLHPVAEAFVHLYNEMTTSKTAQKLNMVSVS